jgi:hypothetical protein
MSGRKSAITKKNQKSAINLSVSMRDTEFLDQMRCSEFHQNESDLWNEFVLCHVTNS